MRTAEELKANYEQGYKRTPISALKQEMLATQQEQLVACIREFFDEGDACGPVCYLNELMKSSADNADGLRISSFIMRLERFDRRINEEINYRVSFGVCEFFNHRNGQISTNIPTAPPISAPGMMNKLPPKNAPPQDEERAAEITEMFPLLQAPYLFCLPHTNFIRKNSRTIITTFPKVATTFRIFWTR